MEPDAQWPSERQVEQSGSMVARQAVIGIVARPAHLGEQGADLARNDALVLQASEQVDQLFFRRREQPDLRGDQLMRQVFGSSAK